MIGTTAAIIAASVIGAGASVAGAKMASGAAQDAAQTQTEAAQSSAQLQKQAADAALAEQKRQFDINQQNQAPWLQAGQSSLQGLLTGMGLGTGGPLQSGELTRQFGMEDFQSDPGYAFRLAEGQKALERSAAAKGGILTGGALKAAARYNQDMASQEYNNAFNRFNIGQTNTYNRFANIAGLGQTAANQMGQYGQNYANQTGNIILGTANNIGDLQTAAANARASGYMGSANAWNNALGGVSGNIMNTILLNQLLNKPQSATTSSIWI